MMWRAERRAESYLSSFVSCLLPICCVRSSGLNLFRPVQGSTELGSTLQSEHREDLDRCCLLVLVLEVEQIDIRCG